MKHARLRGIPRVDVKEGRMRTTEVITIRVGDGFRQRFADFCEKADVTQREAVENLVTDYFEGKIAIDGGHIAPEIVYMDVTEEYDELDDEMPFNDEPGYSEYTEFGFDTFVRLLRKRDYPDEYIKKMVENMISTAYDMPKYNPRRSRSDDGC